MIPVKKKPEPRPPDFDFDQEVRRPGLSALAELAGNPPTMTRPGPRIQQQATRVEDLSPAALRKYAYWTRALDALHEAYDGICAYSCFYIEPVGGPTVDHFVALAAPGLAQAYDWDNYRLACSLMNTHKNKYTDVLDPFLIRDGWFTLNLATFKVEPAEGLDEPLLTQVKATISRLQLDSRDISKTHEGWFNAYFSPKNGQRIPFWFLERRAPFLARELRRQGRVPPGDEQAPTAAPPSPSP
ncbi:hypothetical protein [Corallococcus llansteffanensis]|uniref:TIGR02646 family protein n=1 Tax=Corallococcus llansteffanensis TaxID=2316731 RepID=A0A3A8QNS2_9BACT|nr:hypothetical protein [Corallococcus llansteffanensis]RKH64834.1 hypothetical protein D7V93_06805 [Corallococcus llansteffanensis]